MNDDVQIMSVFTKHELIGIMNKDGVQKPVVLSTFHPAVLQSLIDNTSNDASA